MALSCRLASGATSQAANGPQRGQFGDGVTPVSGAAAMIVRTMHAGGQHCDRNVLRPNTERPVPALMLAVSGACNPTVVVLRAPTAGHVPLPVGETGEFKRKEASRGPGCTEPEPFGRGGGS